jgi:hypothetical protein
VTEFRYVITTITDENCISEEINADPIPESLAAVNLSSLRLSPYLISKRIKIGT